MAFFQLALKARNLEKARQEYEDEKVRSIEISKGAKPPLTWRQRLRRKKLRCKKKVNQFWEKISSCPKNSWFHKKAVSIRTDGTFENYVFKSVFGFFGGMFLTYVFFMFFVFQLNFKLAVAMLFCSIIGVVLSLGLAFSHRVRCVVFLLLPLFFSKRGRQALMAYAFILALSGPAKNTLHNVGVLTESLACGQEQLKEALKAIVDLVKQPFYALREAISKVIKTVKVVVKKIKQTLIAIKRLVLSILRVITSVFQWLGSIVNMCNKKLGTPFDRCQRVFEGAVTDCKAKLGPYLGVICNLTYIVSALCYIVKPLDFICMLVSYVADAVVDTVRRKIQRFVMHMKAMFYVKVKFSHSFHFETNQSKTIEEISTGIVTEIRQRTGKFLTVFDWISLLTVFFVFFLLLRVMHYRHRWLTNERFDNQYITNDLRTIDIVRARQDKETVLPLNQRERNRYIPLSSVTLIQVEKIKLAKSAVFLGLTTFKLLIYMMVDYSLFWILNAIRFHGRFETKVERPSVVSVHVSGDGYLAELYRSIVKAFTPRGKETEIDTMPCLPDPIPPDLDRYTQIAFLIALCWLMAIFEPYGLRIRQVVMCHYHPDRAKQRAAWLYNQIIRSRGSFLKFARRQLRRKFGMTDGEKIERVSLRERLTAMCPFLNVLFPQTQRMCLLCGAVERSDKNLHIKCATPGCAGLFCTQCFADLQNLCTICRSPVEYGDLSDMSEEKDSSDDQLKVAKETTKPAIEKAEPKIEEVAKADGKEVEETKLAKDEEKVEKGEIEQTDGKATEDRTSESSYSYTYQDDSSPEVETEKGKKSFKDIEAQKIRDDVTIQIFNEPLIKETSSSSESPTGCFIVRARRKRRARLKKKSHSSPRQKDSDASTSIADTESWPTEEVDEEEVIHIEVDDGSEELLPKDRRNAKERGRIDRIVGAVARIPWLGKSDSSDKIASRGLKSKRPSLLNKIVSMLQGKESIQTYKRTRKVKKDSGKITSSSSSSSLFNEESRALSKLHDRSTSMRHLTRRKVKRKISADDSSTKSDSQREDVTLDDVNLIYPCEKKFPLKKLPRYLESSMSKDTSYFEVDETEDSRMARKCVRQVEDVSVLSDVGTSPESRRADAWNNADNGEFQSSCSCTTYGTSVKKDARSASMTTISERTDDSSKTQGDTDTEGTTTHTEETESTEPVSKERKVAIDSTAKVKKFDDSSGYDEFGHSKETSDTTTGIDETTQEQSGTESTTTKETVRTAIPGRKTPAASDAKETIQDAAAGSDVRKKVEKTPAESGAKETIRKGPAGSGGPALYDPLAGLELYGVHHKPTKRVRPKLEVEEPEINPVEEKKANVEEAKVEDPKVKKSKDKDSKMKESKNKESKVDDSKQKPEDVEKKAKESRVEESNIKESELGDSKKKIPEAEEKAKKSKTKESKSDDPKIKSTVTKYKSIKLAVDTRTRPVKTDKATDLPDTSRGTQTKRRKTKDDEESKTVRTDANVADVRREETDTKRTKRKKSPDERERQTKSCYVEDQTSQWTQCSDQGESEEFHPPGTPGRFVPGFRSIIQPETQCFRRHGDVPSQQGGSGPTTTCPQHCSQKRYPQSHGDHPSPQRHSCRTSCFQYRDRECDAEVRRRALREIPMLRRYLPMYQTPELIDELKGHDRMKLIREREAERGRRWRLLNPPRTPEQFSICSRKQTQASTKLHEEKNALPYQETEAYKNVMCEFRRNVRRRRQTEETAPLIDLSKRADRTKEVKQLFPRRDRHQGTSGSVMKFTKTVVGAFKINPNRQKKPKSRKQCLKPEERFSETSSFCDCPYRTLRSRISSSTDETTDNESTR